MTCPFRLGLGLIVLALAIAALSVNAQSHKAPPSTAKPTGWMYDPACCGSNDCAPVSKMTWDRSGRMVVTTKHGTVTVPDKLTPRPSQDLDYHACIVNNRLRCLYAPAGL